MDDNLVHFLHISVFGTLSLEYCHKTGQEMLLCDFAGQRLCGRKCTYLVRGLYTVIDPLITIFKVCVFSSCMLCEIDKDRDVIVVHEHFCMIHGLVLPSQSWGQLGPVLTDNL
jgi:hypothetical protein